MVVNSSCSPSSRAADAGSHHAGQRPDLPEASGSGQIEIEAVSHCFQLRHSPTPLLSLDNVSLSVRAGSFVSIVGPSGCGKSTLVKIVAGLFRPTAGLVRVDGQEVKGPSALRAMVFQEDAVFPWLTVQDNVAYSLRRRGTPRRAARAIAHEWIARVGLGGFERSYPRELSGGMRKRVDLARAYAARPRVMLMDEPFGALDALTRRRMQADLLQLWEDTSITVVFVTHDLDEAVFLSDTIVVLSPRPGRVNSTHDVGLERPRNDGTRTDERALLLGQGLWHEVQLLDSTGLQGA